MHRNEAKRLRVEAQLLSLWKPGDRVIDQHEGPGTVVAYEGPHNVIVRFDSDGVECACHPMFLRKEG